MNILVIDDETALADMLVRRLDIAGHCGRAAYTAAQGQVLAREANPDLVLIDLNLPDMDGLALLPLLQAQLPQAKFMVISGQGSTEKAVRALKLGAEDYLEKPFELDELLVLIQKLDQHRGTELALNTLKSAGTRKTLDTMRVYLGAGMQQVYEDLTLVAAQDGVPVLLLGETGSGKEHAARLLHQLSRRFAGPFVEINCAAIPAELIESELFGSEAGAYTDSKNRRVGLFEAAQGGTLFLDEVGDLSLSAQAKLLKVLDERELRRVGGVTSIKLDLRVVAATNKDLASESHTGTFRLDLYYRLNTFVVRLPPLRDRRSDIPELAQYLFDQACRIYTKRLAPLSPAQLKDLSARDWEGNVRELRNIIESSVLRSRNGHFDLPPPCPPPCPPTSAPSGDASAAPPAGLTLRPLKEAVDAAVHAVKRDLLLLALQTAHGNKAEAARLLKTDYKTILNLMKSLDVAG